MFAVGRLRLSRVALCSNGSSQDRRRSRECDQLSAAARAIPSAIPILLQLLSSPPQLRLLRLPLSSQHAEALAPEALRGAWRSPAPSCGASSSRAWCLILEDQSQSAAIVVVRHFSSAAALLRILSCIFASGEECVGGDHEALLSRSAPQHRWRGGLAPTGSPRLAARIERR